MACGDASYCLDYSLVVLVFRVLNRGVGRLRRFDKDRDFETFGEDHRAAKPWPATEVE